MSSPSAELLKTKTVTLYDFFIHTKTKKSSDMAPVKVDKTAGSRRNNKKAKTDNTLPKKVTPTVANKQTEGQEQEKDMQAEGASAIPPHGLQDPPEEADAKQPVFFGG